MTEAHEPDPVRPALSRRDFLKGAGGVAAGGVLSGGLDAAPAAARGPAEVESASGLVPLSLQVNGRTLTAAVEPRTTLLSALRSYVQPPLTGTKLVCDRGNCGACTVLLDGEPVYSCLTLALQAVGRKVRTVEGLAPDGALSPVQRAMHERDGLMCGFCTPGFLMSLTACLEKKPAASLGEIQASCAGNLCRCGTYPFVFEAALQAGREMQERR